MPAPDTRNAPAPDPVRAVMGRRPDSVLLYTLTMPSGQTVDVYGNPDTWKRTAAGLLMDAGRILNRAKVEADQIARRAAVPAVPQHAQLPQE